MVIIILGYYLSLFILRLSHTKDYARLVPRNAIEVLSFLNLKGRLRSREVTIRRSPTNFANLEPEPSHDEVGYKLSNTTSCSVSNITSTSEKVNLL